MWGRGSKRELTGYCTFLLRVNGEWVFNVVLLALLAYVMYI